MKVFAIFLSAIALAGLAAESAGQSVDVSLKSHINKLCDALSAYSLAIKERRAEQVDHTRDGVVAALHDWKVTYQRIVKQLVENAPTGPTEEIYRMRSATALCHAAEGLKEEDLKVFHTDHATIRDWIFVQSLIDYGNSMNYGAPKESVSKQEGSTQKPVPGHGKGT